MQPVSFCAWAFAHRAPSIWDSLSSQPSSHFLPHLILNLTLYRKPPQRKVSPLYLNIFFILEAFGKGLRLEEGHYAHTLRYLSSHLFFSQRYRNSLLKWNSRNRTACLGMVFLWLPGSVMEAWWSVKLGVHYGPARIEKTWIHATLLLFYIQGLWDHFERTCAMCFPLRNVCSVTLLWGVSGDSWMKLSNSKIMPSSVRKKQSQSSSVRAASLFIHFQTPEELFPLKFSIPAAINIPLLYS